LDKRKILRFFKSNNVKFAVVERINPSTTYSSSYLNEDLGEEKEILKLFEREGATEGGWHRVINFKFIFLIIN